MGALSPAADLAQRLARNAESVCRTYLSNGRSLFVRLKGPDHGNGAAGKWTDYVAPRVMLRICDWVLSHRRLTASTQHNASAPREVA